MIRKVKEKKEKKSVEGRRLTWDDTSLGFKAVREIVTVEKASVVSGKKITWKMEKPCHYLIVSKNTSLHWRTQDNNFCN